MTMGQVQTLISTNHSLLGIILAFSHLLSEMEGAGLKGRREHPDFLHYFTSHHSPPYHVHLHRPIHIRPPP